MSWQAGVMGGSCVAMVHRQLRERPGNPANMGRQLWAGGSPVLMLHKSAYLLFDIIEISDFSNV